MNEIDIGLRGAALALAALTVAAFWRSKHRIIAIVYSGLAVAVGSYVLLGLPKSPRPILIPVAYTGGLLFWLFVRAIFDERFRLLPRHGLLLLLNAGFVGIWLVWRNELRGMAPLLFVVPVLFVGDALWRVWGEGRTDLVDARRRARTVLLVAAGTTAIAKIVSAFVFRSAVQSETWLRLADSALTTILLMSVALIFLDFRHGLLEPVRAKAEPAPHDPAEAALEMRLEDAMLQQELWRRTGLTVGELAAHLGIAEHRLRKLLNQKLGYRNFTTFLNKYRLEAAARALRDPSQVRLPILTIALEMGWASIGPFNRAFRAQYGVTPSDYRQSPKVEK